MPETPEQIPTAFETLVVRYLESDLDAAELVRFNQQLRDSETNRRRFAELALLRAGVLEEVGGQAEIDKIIMSPAGFSEAGFSDLPNVPDVHRIDLNDTIIAPALQIDDVPLDDLSSGESFAPASLDPIPLAQQPFRKPLWIIAASVFICLLAGVIGWIVRPVGQNRQPLLGQNLSAAGSADLSPSTRPINEVASGFKKIGTVALQMDAQWDAEVGIAVGMPLESIPGQHRLLKGAVQLNLANGSTLVIQGPARFDVQSDSSVLLLEGKLCAEVPHNGASLTVITPDMRAVDLGTEFGLDVTPWQKTHLEVFRGQVRAEVGSDSKAVAKVLSANEAVSAFSGSNSLVPAVPTPLAFVRPGEMSSLALAGTTSFDRWRGFSQMLRLDPDLVAYYPFDNRSEDPGRLINRAVVTAGKFNGDFGNDINSTLVPAWSVGRWPSKDALVFGNHGSSAVKFQNAPQMIPQQAMTLGVWYRRTELRRAVHFLNGTIKDQTALNIELLGADGKMGLRLLPRTVYFTWSDSEKDIGSNPQCLPGDDQWCFLTITSELGGSINFYIDGQLVCTRPCSAAAVAQVQKLALGAALDSNLDCDQNDFFSGTVDELMIFKRALSPSEVKRIYNAGGSY